MTVDWPTYNEALVKRGEILLDLSLLQSWGDELQEMNRGKEGGRYRYSRSLIELQASLRACFKLAYRQLEGLTRALSRWEPRLKAPTTTTGRRANALDVALEPRLDPERPVTIAVDASGIKVADRGEWARTKWKMRRGFLKIHIAVDVETKQIVAMEVTDERTGDGVMLVPLVEQARRRCQVEGVIGDGAYDSRVNFQYLDDEGIGAAIKVRRNSSRRTRGCPARRRVVEEQLGGPEGWKEPGGGTVAGGWLRRLSPCLSECSGSMWRPEASRIWCGRWC